MMSNQKKKGRRKSLATRNHVDVSSPLGQCPHFPFAPYPGGGEKREKKDPSRPDPSAHVPLEQKKRSAPAPVTRILSAVGKKKRKKLSPPLSEKEGEKRGRGGGRE